MAESDLDLVVAGSRGALVMVEGGGQEVPEAEILEALKLAHGEILIPTIDVQEELREARWARRRSRCRPRRTTRRSRRQVREPPRRALAEAVQIKRQGRALQDRSRDREGGRRDLRHRLPQRAGEARHPGGRRGAAAGAREARKTASRTLLNDLRSELVRKRILAEPAHRRQRPARTSGRSPARCGRAAAPRRGALHPR